MHLPTPPPRDVDATVIYGIDAGGTRTRIRIEAPGMPLIRGMAGSICRVAGGEAVAEERLREAFDIVAGAAAGRPSIGWLATASVVPQTAQEELSLIRRVLPARTRLVVSNDAVPLLFAPPLADRGVVAIAGTGSGFLGGDGRTVLHVGNHDYLGSDDGSAFDIGLQALRAVLRAGDGLGPPTRMGAALSSYVERDIAAEARRLAATPFPKPAVARLAPTVLRCWVEGDEVAGCVVDRAVESLATRVAHLRRRLELTPADGTVVAGSLVARCARFGAAVREACERSAGPHTVTVCTDPAATVLSCARRLASQREDLAVGDAYLEEHAWLLTGR
jgi:N-acetylglucosamine kinase-like BadF-type ATPase